MIELGADQLLAKAEKLLLDVTSCIKIEGSRNRIQESKMVESLLLNSDNQRVKTCDPESDLTQIEWLLRGVPEAYEDEPQVDDEMVLALLKEGGNPPSQLILPSIYATNQLVLEKLSNARRLRIHITNLLVLSVRYGVRKEGTFLRIYPPSGCVMPANEAASIVLPLHELQDPHGQLGALLRKNDKRDSLRNYFVGALDMDRSQELNLLMSEQVVRDWLHSKPAGSLRIELHGYLSPHVTVVRGTHSEAVLLATAVVPLGGLLGTASLDAVVHCDLHVDAYTHAAVLSRMCNITSAPSVSKQKTLGPKLGTVTVRVSLLPAKETASAIAEKSSPTRDHKLLHEVEPLLLPVNAENDTTVLSTDNVHSALAYVPSEHPSVLPSASPSVQPLLQQNSNRSVYGSSAQVKGVFALGLCGLEGFSVPIEKSVEILQHADNSGVAPAAQVVLSFKTQTR